MISSLGLEEEEGETIKLSELNGLSEAQRQEVEALIEERLKAILELALKNEEESAASDKAAGGYEGSDGMAEGGSETDDSSDVITIDGVEISKEALLNALKEVSNKDEGKININTATKEELMELNGIGEARAQSIIDYRETYGGFSNIEEIMNISGIKEAAFSKIKDDICV